jgi:hypothetical protein
MTLRPRGVDLVYHAAFAVTPKICHICRRRFWWESCWSRRAFGGDDFISVYYCIEHVSDPYKQLAEDTF